MEGIQTKKKKRDDTEKIENTLKRQKAMAERFDVLIKSEPKAQFMARGYFYQIVADEFFCSSMTVIRAVTKCRKLANNA